MATIISAVTAIVEESVDWLTAIVGCVTQAGNELLLFYCLVGFVGIAIGLLLRFVNR